MAAPAGQLRALVCDLGGTVLSLDHPRIEHTVRAAGGEPPPEWVARAETAARHSVDEAIRGGSSPNGVWSAFFRDYLLRAGAPAERAGAVQEELEAFHRRHHLWNRTVPGAREMLAAAARAGYRLAVISNSDGRAEWILRQVGLADAFEFVIDSQDVGIEKPDPRIFALATERLELHPEECAYVGDILTIDAEGARAAGYGSVLLDAYGAYGGEPLLPGVSRIVEWSQLLTALGAVENALSKERGLE